jgi:hypothetical protein
VVWVRGNADRELFASTPAPPDPIVPWAAAQLTPELRDHLRGVPSTVTLDVDGLGPTLFCHATPRDDEEVVLVHTASPVGRGAGHRRLPGHRGLAGLLRSAYRRRR